jgi:uncharacterized RDD family membrane protein YckC
MVVVIVVVVVAVAVGLGVVVVVMVTAKVAAMFDTVSKTCVWRTRAARSHNRHS